MTPVQGVAQRAAFLKHAAPSEFEEFVKALSAYSDHILRGVIAAPSDEVLVAQGNAQMLLKVVQTLVECDSPKQNRPTP